MKRTIHLLFILLLVVTSCVPGRRFQEVESEAKRCEEENTTLKKSNEDLTIALDECRSEYDVMIKSTDNLVTILHYSDPPCGE